MHQIVLLTALTATTGLFGGGRSSCGPRGCGMPTTGYSACAPSYGQSYGYGASYGYSCQPGTPCGAPVYSQGATYAAPQQAPVSAPMAPPKVAPAPQAAYYPSYYSYPTTSGCAGGNCYRR